MRLYQNQIGKQSTTAYKNKRQNLLLYQNQIGKQSTTDHQSVRAYPVLYQNQIGILLSNSVIDGRTAWFCLKKTVRLIAEIERLSIVARRGLFIPTRKLNRFWTPGHSRRNISEIIKLTKTTNFSIMNEKWQEIVCILIRFQTVRSFAYVVFITPINPLWCYGFDWLWHHKGYMSKPIFYS